MYPIDDAREYFWQINDKETLVYFGKTPTALLSEDHYDNEILPYTKNRRSIYRKDDYTMICVDTHTDGNKFLQIFDNTKEIKEVELLPSAVLALRRNNALNK